MELDRRLIDELNRLIDIRLAREAKKLLQEEYVSELSNFHRSRRSCNNILKLQDLRICNKIWGQENE